MLFMEPMQFTMTDAAEQLSRVYICLWNSSNSYSEDHSTPFIKCLLTHFTYVSGYRSWPNFSYCHFLTTTVLYTALPEQPRPGVRRPNPPVGSGRLLSPSAAQTPARVRFDIRRHGGFLHDARTESLLVFIVCIILVFELKRARCPVKNSW